MTIKQKKKKKRSINFYYSLPRTLLFTNTGVSYMGYKKLSPTVKGMKTDANEGSNCFFEIH